MPPWLAAAKKRDSDNDYLRMVVQDDLAYENKVTHKYAQFVDGGITDNLGLRALLDAVELAGGPERYVHDARHRDAAPHRRSFRSTPRPISPRASGRRAGSRPSSRR